MTEEEKRPKEEGSDDELFRIFEIRIFENGTEEEIERFVREKSEELEEKGEPPFGVPLYKGVSWRQ